MYVLGKERKGGGEKNKEANKSKKSGYKEMKQLIFKKVDSNGGHANIKGPQRRGFLTENLIFEGSTMPRMQASYIR